MGRHRKLKNPVPVCIVVEKETLEEFDRQRGKLSRGDYIDLLIKQKGPVAQIVAKCKVLEREKAELEELLRKRDQYIEKLESKLRTEQGPKHEISDKEKIQDAIERFFASEEKKTVFNLMRALGHEGDINTVKRIAQEFLKEHFIEEGGKYISKELKLVVKPVKKVESVTGYEVERLE